MAEPRTYPEGVTAWIDVEQADLEAAQAFYAGLFGWTFQDATSTRDATRYLGAQLDGRPVTSFGVEGWPACGTPAEALRQHGLDGASLAERIAAVARVRVP